MGTVAAMYSATPTLRINGQENDRARTLLSAMDLQEAEGGLSSLELRFTNFGADGQGQPSLAFDDGSIALGNDIAVYGGDVNNPVEIFRGIVTGIGAQYPLGGEPEFLVFAEDALQKARMARRTRLHTEVTLAALAGQVAGGLGLTPVVTGLADSIGDQMQLNESDLAFLRRLLARYDADVQVVGSELHVAPRSEVERGALSLAMGTELRSARVLADLSQQATEVTASGWDPAQGQAITSSSAGANLGPGSGRTGAEILRQGIGDRSEHVGHLAVLTSAEADALTETGFDRRARRFVTLEATGEGDPRLRVGTHVSITGLGRLFDNTYYLVRARHRYGLARGYETEFEAECAYLGGS